MIKSLIEKIKNKKISTEEVKSELEKLMKDEANLSEILSQLNEFSIEYAGYLPSGIGSNILMTYLKKSDGLMLRKHCIKNEPEEKRAQILQSVQKEIKVIFEEFVQNLDKLLALRERGYKLTQEDTKIICSDIFDHYNDNEKVLFSYILPFEALNELLVKKVPIDSSVFERHMQRLYQTRKIRDRTSQYENIPKVCQLLLSKQDVLDEC